MYQKNKITISIIVIVVILLSGVIFYKFIYKDYTLLYSQEYIVGNSNIKGSVDTESFSNKGIEFEIGANQAGYAVFKNPKLAFSKLQKDYYAGIELIQKEFNLTQFSKRNYKAYGTYGWQVTSGTTKEKEQASFITAFVDIYENSFK